MPVHRPWFSRSLKPKPKPPATSKPQATATTQGRCTGATGLFVLGVKARREHSQRHSPFLFIGGQASERGGACKMHMCMRTSHFSSLRPICQLCVCVSEGYRVATPMTACASSHHMLLNAMNLDSDAATFHATNISVLTPPP